MTLCYSYNTLNFHQKVPTNCSPLSAGIMRINAEANGLPACGEANQVSSTWYIATSLRGYSQSGH